MFASSDSFLHGSLSSVQKKGVLHPLCGDEEHTLICIEKEYVILAIGERYTFLCDEKSLSTPCIEERHSPLYI